MISFRTNGYANDYLYGVFYGNPNVIFSDFNAYLGVYGDTQDVNLNNAASKQILQKLLFTKSYVAVVFSDYRSYSYIKFKQPLSQLQTNMVAVFSTDTIPAAPSLQILRRNGITLTWTNMYPQPVLQSASSPGGRYNDMTNAGGFTSGPITNSSNYIEASVPDNAAEGYYRLRVGVQ